jgi:transketolase
MAQIAQDDVKVQVGEEEVFPIDLSKYQKVSIDPWTTEAPSAEQKAALQANIQVCRDAIVMFTSVGGASGYGGHTGGAFDMMPEVCILDAFFNGAPERFVSTFFDEAGHRVGTQYLFSVLRGHMKAGQLLKYRQGHSMLPGHPELGKTAGIEFSSGRLGHMWPMVNGVAMGSAKKVVCAFSSDGSQMEGNTAEAARVASANGLNVKLFIDDNDVTIAGHPSEYLKGYNVGKTLKGHNIESVDVDGEDFEALYKAMRQAIITEGPFAVVLKRPMCPGIEGVEGTPHGHDAVAKAKALKYFETRGLQSAADRLNAQGQPKDPYTKYLGCGSFGAPRQVFGDSVNAVLDKISTPEERKERVCVIDSDLEGSCGLQKIRMAHPEVYISSGIMERGNFSACAGFGFNNDRQGIFGTFAAFQEMIISEVTMARLNRCNVMCHFSHSGVDDMSDNNCHFGQNNFFADCGLAEESGPGTELFMPADAHQMRKVVDSVFWSRGLRFIYSTRSKVPEILNKEGQPFFGEGYEFKKGKDDVIREGAAGYIVSYGDALYRSLDAVERLAKEGISVGLVNKCHLNAIDEEVMAKVGSSGFVLVVESQNTKTGLGIRFGTWLLERGLSPRFARCGTHRDGCGGQWEHAYHQGYDPESVMAEVRKLAKESGCSKPAKVDQVFVGA